MKEALDAMEQSALKCFREQMDGAIRDVLVLVGNELSPACLEEYRRVVLNLNNVVIH
jgi:hypothetical protein